MTTAKLVGVVALALGVIAAGIVWRAAHRPPADNSAPAPDRRAPQGVRVRVGVLNGTKTRGLARRATMLLRDRGFDVLEMGTDPGPRDTTIVYDLTGHPDWARRIARTFTPARIDARADSSRYLDVVVVLGATWRPPAQPFYP
jgi:LytR cell envelope-related transcriptional attenuator